VRIYAFEELDDRLELMPLAARRAADVVGLKPTLSAWQSAALELRRELSEVGSVPEVDRARAAALLAELGAVSVEPIPEPPGEGVPASLQAALGAERSLSPNAWSALTPLDRYALMKVARRGESARLARAYDEIVGASAHSSHLAPDGSARMVGISEKKITVRRAAATARVTMNEEAFERLARADAPKGDVLGTARLAGILGAKRTPELIPLCHPVALTRVDVALELEPAARAVAITARVEAFDRTGVEMEALTAASTAALTVYDMLKAFDRGMEIGPVRLEQKSGGRTGDYVRDAAPAETARFRVSADPLRVELALELVRRPEAGGTALFVGTVRDHNEGRSVVLLEYEAYVSMAIKEMERIARELESELEGVRLSVLHRIGELRIGDLAVVCAASAPHRDAAFRACRALIDRVKERVPIWKREHGPDGPYWVGWEDARVPPR